MTYYDTEQGGDTNHDASRMDADLKPFLSREWGADVFISEFPYFQYAGQDFDPAEDDDIQEYLSRDYTPDSAAEATGYSDFIFQKGPYRTDLVAVNPDIQALRTRARRLGHLTSLNGSRDTKRRRRRTYLSFRADGPMTRPYWENNHGGEDEVRSYGEHSASRAFGWLKKRGFLANVGGAWDAVDIPLHVHGRTHALELKLARGEWDTALEQAARADVFADYRWVVMDADSADVALANTDRFQSEGVGLLTVHPSEGVTIHVWAEQCTRPVDRAMLDRYNVERWDLNERVLTRLTDASPELDVGRDEPRIRMESLGVTGDGEADVPTVNTGHSVKMSPDEAEESSDHIPLSEFAEDDG